MNQVVLASSNVGKLRELQLLLAPLDVRLIAQSELGIETPEETGRTFIENALLKARHACIESGKAALADDSGLMVDHLGGLPGVRSARYAGAQATDADNNRKLVEALADAPRGGRTARFVCVLAYLAHPDDAAPLVATGVWQGEILKAPRGAGGFGYDPWFLAPDLGRTAAELSRQEKSRHSHRGQAMRALIAAWPGMR